jgi:hypothetical protein
MSLSKIFFDLENESFQVFLDISFVPANESVQTVMNIRGMIGIKIFFEVFSSHLNLALPSLLLLHQGHFHIV